MQEEVAVVVAKEAGEAKEGVPGRDLLLQWKPLYVITLHFIILNLEYAYP
jgi:hypothetical protein